MQVHPNIARSKHKDTELAFGLHCLHDTPESEVVRQHQDWVSDLAVTVALAIHGWRDVDSGADSRDI
jgi:hypothetical protein